jgi:hypothetical protein
MSAVGARPFVGVRTRPAAPPPALPVAPIAPPLLAHGWPPVWWVGCHGGAGTSTLARITDLGVNAGRAWPVPEPGWPATNVLLVCRATATGTWAATGAVEQWRRGGTPPGTQLVGLVAVAASARRPPRVVAERLQLVGGWVPKVWRLGWVEAYLAADDPRDVGVPPDVARLRHAVGRVLNIEVGTR